MSSHWQCKLEILNFKLGAAPAAPLLVSHLRPKKLHFSDRMSQSAVRNWIPTDCELPHQDTILLSCKLPNWMRLLTLSIDAQGAGGYDFMFHRGRHQQWLHLIRWTGTTGITSFVLGFGTTALFLILENLEILKFNCFLKVLQPSKEIRIRCKIIAIQNLYLDGGKKNQRSKKTIILYY